MKKVRKGCNRINLKNLKLCKQYLGVFNQTKSVKIGLQLS